MSSVIVDLSNRRFGKLLILGQNGRDKWGQVLWKCRCDCGNERTITSGNLRRNKGNVSCGCAKAERIRQRSMTHGKSGTAEYKRYKDFVKRYRKYGLTEEDYERLKKQQDFRCAICGVVPDSVSSRLHDGFHIDHCHVSGRVRGLLCSNCNTGIGMLKESEIVLKAAIEYLRRAHQ